MTVKQIAFQVNGEDYGPADLLEIFAGDNVTLEGEAVAYPERFRLTIAAAGGTVVATGRVKIPIANADHVLTPTEQAALIWQFTGNATLTRTMTAAAPATDAGAYVRYIQNDVTTSNLVISTGATTVTLPPGARANLLFTPDGVDYANTVAP